MVTENGSDRASGVQKKSKIKQKKKNTLWTCEAELGESRSFLKNGPLMKSSQKKTQQSSWELDPVKDKEKYVYLK